MALLRQCGWDKPIFVHGALMELTRLYQKFGVDLGEVRHVTTAPKSTYAGHIVLCPPAALQTPWAQALSRSGEFVRLGLDAHSRPGAAAIGGAAAWSFPITPIGPI